MLLMRVISVVVISNEVNFGSFLASSHYSGKVSGLLSEFFRLRLFCLCF